ncbi:MAG: hypothetical protein RL367_47 [Pseudomonadota bacterium]|jgi:DNA-binding XRE family transcriptional regulator
MTFQPQIIASPDGTKLVIITEAEYLALREAKEDAEDLALAFDGLIATAKQGTIPAEISRAVRGGSHPIIAWRKFRNLTQSELAMACGVTQPAIARLEKAAVGSGERTTLENIARALDAPLWSLERNGGNRASH